MTKRFVWKFDRAVFTTDLKEVGGIYRITILGVYNKKVLRAKITTGKDPVKAFIEWARAKPRCFKFWYSMTVGKDYDLLQACKIRGDLASLYEIPLPKT